MFGFDAARPGFDDEPHLLRRFVADIAHERQFARLHQVRHPFDEAGFLDLPGNFRDDDLVAALGKLLHIPPCTKAKSAAAGVIGLGDGTAGLHQHTACGEIRPGHEFRKLADGRLGELDQMQKRVAKFARIVGRDRGRHADGDAGGAIGKQIGKGGGQDERFAFLAVIGFAEINRILVDAGEKRAGHRRQPRLGVAHGGRVVAVDIPEIPLPVHKRITHRERLGEAHQRVIDGSVAMGMIFADNVAHHPGAFLESGGGVQPELKHGIQQTPMHRLEPVAHVRQGAGHDGR